MIYLSVFLASLLLSLFLVAPVKQIALRAGALAYPGGRSIHSQPTPLWGGIAIYLTCTFVVVFFYHFYDAGPISASLRATQQKLWGFFLGGTVLLIVGIIDDYRAMSARTKLLGQLISICICALFGFTIEAIQLPIVGTIMLGDLGRVLFVCWVLAITNAINLVDGMDGLASTVGFFACIGNGLIALLHGNVFIAFFSFMLAGSLVGFLFHNFPPARIFLGDTGSMLIGYMLAVMVIQSNMQKRSTTLMVLAPLLLLAFSLLDVALSIVRRFLRGKPIFSSDMGHIHHRLIAKFDNPRRVLLIVGGFSLFTMVLSIVVVFGKLIPPLLFAATMLLSGILMVMFVRLLGYFRIERIRHILETREDVKFFVSLMSYLRSTMPKADSFEALIDELDWVLRAMKPELVTISDERGEILYQFRCNCPTDDKGEFYEDQKRFPGLVISWKTYTQNEDVKTCDVRLLWQEFFSLFQTEWERVGQMVPGSHDSLNALRYEREGVLPLQNTVLPSLSSQKNVPLDS